MFNAQGGGRITDITYNIAAGGSITNHHFGESDGSGSSSSKQLETVEPSKRFWFEVPKLLYSFCGREKFLKELHTSLQVNESNVLSICVSPLKVVSGLGGMGKTQTAIKFIYEYQDFYNNIIWISAETEATMKSAFLRLADELHLPNRNFKSKIHGIRKVVKNVYEKLFRGVKSTLFVFDDADDYENGIRKFLPPINSSEQKKLSILVTSRNQGWPLILKNARVLVLSGLTDEEALDFTLKQLQIPDSPETRQKSKEFIELIGGLPLALQQSVAYIKEKQSIMGTDYRFSDYIKDFKSTMVNILDYDKIPGSHSTLFKTFNVTLERVKTWKNGTMSLEIIETLAFLFVDKISLNFINLLFTKYTNPDIYSALRLLDQYLLVQLEFHENDDCFVRIHRQLQFVIIQSLNFSNNIEGVFYKLVEGCRVILKTTNLSQKSDIFNYINRLVENPYNVIPITEKFLDFVEEFAEVMFHAARYPESLNLCTKVYNNRRELLGEYHKKTINAQLAMTKRLTEMGMHEESLKLCQDVLEKMKAYLDPVNKLAGSPEIYSTALIICLEVETNQVAILGENHPDTLNTTQLKGQAFFQLNKVEEAFAVFTQVHEKRKDILGEQHPHSIYTLEWIEKAIKLRNRKGSSRDPREDSKKHRLRSQPVVSRKALASRIAPPSPPIEYNTAHHRGVRLFEQPNGKPFAGDLPKASGSKAPIQGIKTLSIHTKPEIKHQLFFNILNPIKHFYSPSELNPLSTRIKNDLKDPPSINYYLITGVPGIGKTEFVRKLIKLHLSDFGFIGWIDASTSDKAKEDFEDLALNLLQIPGEASLEMLVVRVYDVLLQRDGMIVFDNVSVTSSSGPMSSTNQNSEINQSNVFPFLPKHRKPTCRFFVILITQHENLSKTLPTPSRVLFLSNLPLRGIQIVLSKQLDFLEKVHPENFGEILELSQMIETPLEMQKAVEHIKREFKRSRLRRKVYTVGQYIQTKRQLQDQLATGGTTTKPQPSKAFVQMDALFKFRSQMTQVTELKTCSKYGEALDILNNVDLSNLSLKDKLRFQLAMGEIKDCLGSFREATVIFEQVTQTALSIDDEFSGVLIELFHIWVDKEDKTAAKWVLEGLEKFRGFKRKTDDEKDIDIQYLEGCRLEFDGHLVKALELFQSLEPLLKTFHSGNVEFYLTVRRKIAVLLPKIDKQKALKATKSVFQECSEHFGLESVVTLKIAVKLAEILDDTASKVMALQVLEDALLRFEHYHGEKNVFTVQARHKLAERLKQAGHLQESYTNFERNFQIYQAQYPADSPKVQFYRKKLEELQQRLGTHKPELSPSLWSSPPSRRQPLGSTFNAMETDMVTGDASHTVGHEPVDHAPETPQFLGVLETFLTEHSDHEDVSDVSL